MSVNGLSFPTMTNKVNILITISTYETAQLITANLCQPMPTYANLCQPMPIKGETLGLYAIFDRSNQGPTYANHDPKKLIKIVIKMLTLFVMVDNGRQ